MIEPQCRICNNKLQDFGAVLISPPYESTGRLDKVIKSHICKSCYVILTDWMINYKKHKENKTTHLKAEIPEGVEAYLDLNKGNKLEWKMDYIDDKRVAIVSVKGITSRKQEGNGK